MKLLLCAILVQSCAGLRMLQVSDFHLDVDYSTNGDTTKMCHFVTGQTTNPQLGVYGDYMCDAPMLLVNYTIAEARRIASDVDMVIWTGDNVPHIDGYDMNYVINAITQTTTVLFNAFKDVPILLPTFGNHDYAPANAFGENSSLYVEIYKQWGPRIGESNRDTFYRGGYYKYVLPTAVVVVLNTNIYYTSNNAYTNFTDKDDPSGQWAFLESELISATRCQDQPQLNCQKYVHIIGHIGPGFFERTPNMPWFREAYTQRFLQLYTKYASVIKWMIYGHHHTDTFHLITEGVSEEHIGLLLMSPAVTPWFSDLPGAGSNNPAFRIFDIRDDTQDYREISTFFIDLDTLNNATTTLPHFTLLYNYTQAYHLTEITGRSMRDLVERMQSDSALFMNYITYNSVGWKPSLPIGEFRFNQFCSLLHIDQAGYSTCMATFEASTSTLQTTTTSIASARLAAIALLITAIACTQYYY